MKKALLFGLLWWVIVFVEVSIVGFTPGLATMGEFGFTLLPVGVAIHFAVVTLLAWFLARFYFRKGGANLREGIRAAAVMSVVGLLLDAVITVPFFVKSYEHYYSKWTLWAGLLVFVAAFVGSTMALAKRAKQ